MVEPPDVPPTGGSELDAARDAATQQLTALRAAKIAEQAVVVRIERAAELIRGVGELWLTFGILEPLIELGVRNPNAAVPSWWWWMVAIVAGACMLLGTLAGEDDAAAALLRDVERR